MVSSEDTSPAGKGRPTPKRKQQEALKKRPLVPDRKTSSANRSEQRRVQQRKEYAAMQSGDVRNMPAQHQGDARAYLRDYVDARTTIGEFMLPLALVALGMIFFAGKIPAIAGGASFLMLVVLLAWVVETFFLYRRVRKLAVAKFGAERIPRGFAFYAVTRLSQMRALRQPKPRVKRGEYPA